MALIKKLVKHVKIAFLRYEKMHAEWMVQFLESEYDHKRQHLSSDDMWTMQNDIQKWDRAADSIDAEIKLVRSDLK